MKGCACKAVAEPIEPSVSVLNALEGHLHPLGANSSRHPLIGAFLFCDWSRLEGGPMSKNAAEKSAEARQALLNSLSETVAASGAPVVLDRGTMMYLGRERQASMASLSILQAASGHQASDATPTAAENADGETTEASNRNAKLQLLSLMPPESENIRNSSGWHGSRPAPVPRHLVQAAVAEARETMRRSKVQHPDGSKTTKQPANKKPKQKQSAKTRLTSQTHRKGGTRKPKAPTIGSGSRTALATLMSMHETSTNDDSDGDIVRSGLSQYMHSSGRGAQSQAGSGGRLGFENGASGSGEASHGSGGGVMLGLEKLGVSRVDETGASDDSSSDDNDDTSKPASSRGSSATRVSLLDGLHEGLGLAAHLALENATSAGVVGGLNTGKVGVQRTLEVLRGGLSADVHAVSKRAQEKLAAKAVAHERWLQSDRLHRLRDGDDMALVECVGIEAAASCPRKLPEWAPERVRGAAVQLQAGSSSIPLVEARLQFLSKLSKAREESGAVSEQDEVAAAAAWAERTAVDPATSSLVLRSGTGEASRMGDRQASGALGFNVDRFRATNHPVPDRDVKRWCELLSRQPIDRHDSELDALNSELGPSVAILEHLSPLLRRRFFRYATVVSAAPGDVLFEQGDPGNAVFVILRGLVAVQLAQASTRDSSDITKISAKNLTRVYRVRHGVILRRKRKRAAHKMQATANLMSGGGGGGVQRGSRNGDGTDGEANGEIGTEIDDASGGNSPRVLTAKASAAEVWAESTRGLRKKLEDEDVVETDGVAAVTSLGRTEHMDAHQAASMKVQQGQLEGTVLDSLQMAVDAADKQGRKLLAMQGFEDDDAWVAAPPNSDGEQAVSPTAQQEASTGTKTKKLHSRARRSRRKASVGDLEAALEGRGVAPRRMKIRGQRRTSAGSEASSQVSTMSATRMKMAKRRRRMSIDSAISLSTDSSASGSASDDGDEDENNIAQEGHSPRQPASGGGLAGGGGRVTAVSTATDGSKEGRSRGISVMSGAQSPSMTMFGQVAASGRQSQNSGRTSAEDTPVAGGVATARAGSSQAQAPPRTFPKSDIEADEVVLNTIAVLGPTTSFGEKGVVSKERIRKASIAATEPTILLRVKGGILRSLVRENRRRQRAMVSLALRRSKVFAAFPDSAVHYLADAAQSLKFKPGQRIVSQGDELSGLWLINQGEASLARKILAPPILVDGMRRLQHFRDVVKPDAPSQDSLDDLRSRGEFQPEPPAHFKKLPKPVKRRNVGTIASRAAARATAATAARRGKGAGTGQNQSLSPRAASTTSPRSTATGVSPRPGGQLSPRSTTGKTPSADNDTNDGDFGSTEGSTKPKQLRLRSRDALGDLLRQSALSKQQAEEQAATAAAELRKEIEEARAKREGDVAKATVVGVFKAAADVGLGPNPSMHRTLSQLSLLSDIEQADDSGGAISTSPRSLHSTSHHIAASPRAARGKTILRRAASEGRVGFEAAAGSHHAELVVDVHAPAAESAGTGGGGRRGGGGVQRTDSGSSATRQSKSTSRPKPRTAVTPATVEEMALTEPLDVPLKPLRPGDVVGFVDLLAIYAAVSLPPPVGPNLAMGKGQGGPGRGGGLSNLRDAKAAVKRRRNMDWSAVTSSFTAEPEPGTPVAVEVIFLPRAAVLEVAALFPDAVWQSLSKEAEGLPDDAALRSLVAQRFIWDCYSLDKAAALSKVRGKHLKKGSAGGSLGSTTRESLTYKVLQPRWQPEARSALADLRSRCNKLTPLLNDDPTLGVGMSEGGLFHSLAANERSAKEPTVSVQAIPTAIVPGATALAPSKPTTSNHMAGRAGSRTRKQAKAGTSSGRLVLPPQQLRTRTAAVVGGIRALLAGKMTATEAASSMTERGVRAMAKEARERELERMAQAQAGHGGAGSEWLGQWRESQSRTEVSGSALSVADTDVLARAVQAAVSEPASGPGQLGGSGEGLSFPALVNATRWLKETDGIDDSTLAAVITTMKADSDKKRLAKAKAIRAASRATSGETEEEEEEEEMLMANAEERNNGDVDLFDGTAEQEAQALLEASKGAQAAGIAFSGKKLRNKQSFTLLAVLQRATSRAKMNKKSRESLGPAPRGLTAATSPKSRAETLAAQAQAAAEQADATKPGTLAHAAAAYFGDAIDPEEAAAANTELRLWAGLAATQTTLATAAGALTARALAEAAESMFAHVSVARSQSSMQQHAEFATDSARDAGNTNFGVPGATPRTNKGRAAARLIPGPRMPAHTVLRRLQSSAISHTVNEAATEAAARVSLSREGMKRSSGSRSERGSRSDSRNAGTATARDVTTGTAMSALEGKVEEMPLPLFAVPRDVRRMAQLRQHADVDDITATVASKAAEREAAPGSDPVPSGVLRAAHAGARGEVWGAVRRSAGTEKSRTKTPVPETRGAGTRGGQAGWRRRGKGHLVAAGASSVKKSTWGLAGSSSSARANGSLSARS